MLRTWQFRLLTALGGLALLLSVVNIGLYENNRTAQVSLNARVQYLQQTNGIRDITQQIAQGLAELALKNNDEQLRAMLSSEGFLIKPPATSDSKGGNNKP